MEMNEMNGQIFLMPMYCSFFSCFFFDLLDLFEGGGPMSTGPNITQGKRKQCAWAWLCVCRVKDSADIVNTKQRVALAFLLYLDDLITVGWTQLKYIWVITLNIDDNISLLRKVDLWVWCEWRTPAWRLQVQFAPPILISKYDFHCTYLCAGMIPR